MSNPTLISAMRARVPFFLARRLLAENGFPRGHSWDSIIEKIAAIDDASSLNWDGLLDAYRETITATEKLLRIYPIDPDEMDGLRFAVDSVAPDGTYAATAAYPFVLSSTQMVSAQHDAPRLVAIEQFSNATALVFSAVRARIITEVVPTTALPDGLSGRYRELVGYVAVNKQYFDVALVPHDHDAVYILTEYLELTAPERMNAQASVRIAFNNLMGANYLQEPLNLFPAVSSLYNSNDGRVFDLGSMTDTSMEKREKMHAGSACVREDPGHQAAIDAGVGFAAFGIGIEWQLPHQTGHSIAPTLVVAGPAKLAFETSPVIEEALIRKCAHYDEFYFAMNKLLSALGGSQA